MSALGNGLEAPRLQVEGHTDHVDPVHRVAQDSAQLTITEKLALSPQLFHVFESLILLI